MGTLFGPCFSFGLMLMSNFSFWIFFGSHTCRPNLEGISCETQSHHWKRGTTENPTNGDPNALPAIPTVTLLCHSFIYFLTFYSGILSDILFWNSFWHFIWDSTWHSILTSYSGILSGIYSGILSAYTLTSHLTFFLACYLAFFPTVYLRFYLASFQAFILGFFLASVLTFCLAIHLAHVRAPNPTASGIGSTASRPRSWDPAVPRQCPGDLELTVEINPKRRACGMKMRNHGESSLEGLACCARSSSSSLLDFSWTTLRKRSWPHWRAMGGWAQGKLILNYFIFIGILATNTTASTCERKTTIGFWRRRLHYYLHSERIIVNPNGAAGNAKRGTRGIFAASQWDAPCSNTFMYKCCSFQKNRDSRPG